MRSFCFYLKGMRETLSRFGSQGNGLSVLSVT